MGNDGGSIPTRRELVKEAARDPNLTAVKEKRKEHLAHRWSQCPVSHKALVKPIVADYSGDLYNKDAILQYLLPEEVSPLDKVEADKFIQGRVKSLKDVVEVHFQIEKDDRTKTEKWLCPVTSKELGPNTKAVFLVPCGHAFSREAIEATKDDKTCPSCASSYEVRDIVPLLPYTDADKHFVLERIGILKAAGLTHSLKKASGSKKRKANGNTKGEGEDDKSVSAKHTDKNKTSRPTTTNSMTSTSIKNTATASLTAKVLEEEAAKKKRRIQMGENENLKSLYNTGGNKVKDGDFMTRGFSIPANAKHT